MAEEFTESEVIFSNFEDCHEVVDLKPKQQQQQQEEENSRSLSNEKKVVNSVPVNIPEAKVGRKAAAEEDDEEMIPPHEIIARRIAGKMTFSVCTGIGRTLKGRDLSQVRNSILRLTGFLEA